MNEPAIAEMPVYLGKRIYLLQAFLVLVDPSIIYVINAIIQEIDERRTYRRK